MIGENLQNFGGLPVKDFQAAGDIPDFAKTCPRLRCEYDNPMSLTDKLAIMYDLPGVQDTTALVFGLWAENGSTYEISPQPALDMMVSFKDRLPALSAFFSGDIVSEENEISWIGQGDYSAVWAAFPRLKEFGARGGNGLSLGTINHQELRKIVIQTGGLDRGTLREALAANAPIEHFEVWLGSDEYGANTSIEDFADLFADRLFPQLHTLGLCNSQYADALAEGITASALLDRIKVLDLSGGALTDKGARALIASGKLGHLERLDITFHYVSPEVVQELARHTPNLIADDMQKPEEWDGKAYYYISVSE